MDKAVKRVESLPTKKSVFYCVNIGDEKMEQVNVFTSKSKCATIKVKVLCKKNEAD